MPEIILPLCTGRRFHINICFLTCLQRLNKFFVYFYARNYKYTSLKGQSNEIFTLQFFSSFEPAWAKDLRVKIFSILVNFSPIYSNFSESPRGMILRRVNLPGVSYPGESNDFSRSYLKGQSNKIFDMFFS